MNTVCRDIFRAVHEGKWLSIEYKNGKNEITKYWIGIISINPIKKSMEVQGLHLAQYTIRNLYVFIDSIQSSCVIEGSYFEPNQKLIDDINQNPVKYKRIFDNVANLKILNYLIDCNKMDSVPYKTDYALIDNFDGEWNENYKLDETQFRQIVTKFQYKTHDEYANKTIKQLAINVLSINTPKGLYVLAYRKLRLDVAKHMLRQDDEITICMEFALEKNKTEAKFSVRKFLDADDYELLNDFDKNQELIKDKITKYNSHINGVDDMPYVIAIGRNVMVDLHKEYEAINKMYENNEVTIPIKAFFGELLKQVDRRKNYPITLLDKRINLDQLLAIHNAMKYPLAYIQGPPGTGKTNTIVNTMVTAFFNEKTVLFASYNNHPIDGVCDKLKAIKYRNKGAIPFPIIRLGNDRCVLEALNYIKELYEKTKDITIFDSTLEKNKDDKTKRTAELTKLLEKHEHKIELKEREEAIQKMIDVNNHLTFQTELQGVQLAEVKDKLSKIGDITDEQALKLVEQDEEVFKKYLYYTSAKYIQRLKEPKNQDLMAIVECEDERKKVQQFNSYIRQEENLKKFQRIFPIIATTSISAHKIGKPGTYFDMVIMDEASQGNIAMSLVPIIRGRSLMLVGDPQQLSPVILLNQTDNEKLKKIYGITSEYDYIKNSIYKTYLACDAVSEEILLSHHYRCNRKIISFNNKKYYNNKLVINSAGKSDTPLILKNITGETTHYKNTAPREAEEIIEYIKNNSDKSIGIITPFSNQKELINEMLKENKIDDVPCGTVHAFQGDEKDVVLFSLALTQQTNQGTYDWLKNNKELINVATSRAKDQLVILTDVNQLRRLHNDKDDDIYELVKYVNTNGESQVTARETSSRALGIKPYSTQTEAAFLTTLNHALNNVLNTNNRCVVQKEVSIAHVFQENTSYDDLFYTGRFDFVVYEKGYKGQDIPILAIELDGKEHRENSMVKARDEMKNKICKEHGFELIRVENSYARRYNYIKNILIQYFKSIR
jgi:hypothetical protein